MSCNIFFESYPAAGEVIFQGDSMSTLLANSDNDRDLFPSVPRSQTSPNCALYMVKSSFVWRKVPAQILRADSAPSLDVRQKNILKKMLQIQAADVNESLWNSPHRSNNGRRTKARDWCYVTFMCLMLCPGLGSHNNFTRFMARSTQITPMSHGYNTSLHVNVLHN